MGRGLFSRSATHYTCNLTMLERFLRAEMLLGQEAMERLRESHVAVFGLGGVGSWCADALARSGIGKITLVDQDTVSESNINRQLCALSSTVGKPKAEVMAERLRDINPEISVYPMVRRYEAQTRSSFFETKYNYIVDCIDLVACKLDLIESALANNIPIISALGTGNKLDPEALQITDISKTVGCPFARVMRKELRRRGITHLTVVYSSEEALTPANVEEPPPGCRSVPGSLVWVTATAGMLLCSQVVRDIVGHNK